MGLFKPAWMSDNLEKASKAVAKEMKQSKLAEIAKNAPNKTVRLRAIEKLDDQNALAKIGLEDSDPYNREVAAERLADKALAQKIIIEICQNGSDEAQRIRLLQKWVEDDALLAKLAQADKSPSMRREAVAKLLDQDLLGKIAKNDRDGGVRQMAADKLHDQALLTQIAKSDKDGNVRRTAVEKLTDQTLFMDIFNEDPCPEVKVAALNRIKDGAFVKKHAYADQEKSPMVRIAAITRWAIDKDLIEAVAGLDPAHQVRKKAFELLGEAVPQKKDARQRAWDRASSSAFNEMMNATRAAAQAGTLKAQPNSPQNAANYLANMNATPVTNDMIIAAAREIAQEAIQYIGHEVNLTMARDPELLSKENALYGEMHNGNDLAGLQSLVAAYLLDIGRGRMTGTHFPTGAYRLAYLIKDTTLLKQIITFDSHVYEYQKIKDAATAQFLDLGGKLPTKKKDAAPTESKSYYGLSLVDQNNLKYEGPLQSMALAGDSISQFITSLRGEMPSLHLLLTPQLGLVIVIRDDGDFMGFNFQSPMSVDAAAGLIASLVKSQATVTSLEAFGSYEIVI